MGYVEDLRGKKQGRGRPRWRARWRDPAGRERSKSFARKVDAERFLVGVEDAKLRGAYVDPAAGKVELGEWAERWFATTATLRPSTRRDYRNLLDNQVLPTFADVPLNAIDTLAVREWQAGLIASGLGGKRAGKALQVLSQVLASAVEGGKLARNAASAVKPPKVQRKEMHFLDARQVEWLADAIGPPYDMLVRFAAYTGLRPEELVALRVGDLDLLRGTARVSRAATEVGGRLEWGGVKTHEARTVRLPRFLCDQLAADLATRPHGHEDLVFAAPLGGPLRENNFMGRRFRPATRRCACLHDPGDHPSGAAARCTADGCACAAYRTVVPEGLRMYDLRHTAASLLIAQGASVKAVQAQLGHKSAVMTLDLYGHLFPDETDRLAERLEHARAEALTSLAPTQRGPEVVQLHKSAGG